jgi:hypothetical protein
MMTKIHRVVVPLDSQDRMTFGIAVGYGEKIARAAGVSDVILVTHTKSQLKHTALFGILGPAVSKALANGKTASLGSWGTMRGETMKTIGHRARNAVVIAYYADEKLLDIVDGLHGVVGVVAVPWVPGEADGWVARWNAVVHGQQTQQPQVLIGDQVVVRALETLTAIINLSTGLGHPRDKQMANEILRILRAKGHRDPSGTIKSWAIRNNWSPSAASELEALAKKIWSLKTKPSLSGFHDPDGRYESWKEDS